MFPAVVKSVLDFLGARKKKASPIRISIPDVMPKLPRWQRRRGECAKMQVRHQRLRSSSRADRAERAWRLQSNAVSRALDSQKAQLLAFRVAA